jgi:alpha-acetolactate decarboxylase
MADSDLLSLLGTNDLLNFNNTVQQNDMFGITGNAIGAWSPNTSTWSPTETGVASFGKAFLSGILGNYARQRAGNQLQSVIGTLPALRSDPANVGIPEGVDSSAFNILKGSAILKKAQRDSIVGEEGKSNVGDLLKTVLGEGVKSGKISPADAMKAAMTGDYSMLDKPKTASITDGSAISNNMPVLTTEGRRTTEQRVKDLTQSFIEAGQPPTQASVSARKEVEGEIKANTKSFDEAREARMKGQELLDLASTAEAGQAQAGQTGSKLASLYEKTVSTLSPFETPEADRQAAGDALIGSVAPKMVQMMRSPGAVSDFENQQIVKASPSVSNTPQQNAIITERIKELGKLQIEYADFLEAYRDQNSGSTSGANKKWAEYRQSFPLFVGEGDNFMLNSSRPSWQEYFSGQAGGGQQVQTDPLAADKRAFAIDAKARGLSKQQAIDEWNSLTSGRGNRG